MKALKILLVSLLVLAALVVATAVFVVPALVKRGTETASTETMEVETTVGSAAVDYSQGGVTIHKYLARNPRGFLQPSFLEIGTIEVKAGVSELRRDPVEVSEVVISAPQLTIEQATLGSNVSTIMEAVKKKPGNRWKIGKLKILGGKVKFVLPLTHQETVVDVPDVELENLTNADGGPAMMGDIIRQSVSAMIEKTVDKGGIPLDFRNHLAEGAGLEKIGKVKEILNDAVEKVKDVFGGIFGGKKKEAEKK